VQKVKNLTTDLEIRPPERDQPIEVTEIGDLTLTFFASSVAKEGQLIGMTGELASSGQSPTKFDVTGRIVDAAKVDDKLHKVSVHLHQFDKQVWGKWFAAASEAQRRVDRIFDSIRGEE